MYADMIDRHITVVTEYDVDILPYQKYRKLAERIGRRFWWEQGDSCILVEGIESLILPEIRELVEQFNHDYSEDVVVRVEVM